MQQAAICVQCVYFPQSLQSRPGILHCCTGRRSCKTAVLRQPQRSTAGQRRNRSPGRACFASHPERSALNPHLFLPQHRDSHHFLFELLFQCHSMHLPANSLFHSKCETTMLSSWAAIWEKGWFKSSVRTVILLPLM